VRRFLVLLLFDFFTKSPPTDDVSVVTTSSDLLSFTTSLLHVSRQAGSWSTSGLDSEGTHAPGDNSDVGLSELRGWKSPVSDFRRELGTDVIFSGTGSLVLPRFQKRCLANNADFFKCRRVGGNIVGRLSSLCVVSAAGVELCELEERDRGLAWVELCGFDDRDRGLACGRAFSDTRDRLLSDGVKYRLRASTRPRGGGRFTGSWLSASTSGDVAGELWSSMSLVDMRRDRDGEATSEEDPTTASD